MNKGKTLAEAVANATIGTMKFSDKGNWSLPELPEKENYSYIAEDKWNMIPNIDLNKIMEYAKENIKFKKLVPEAAIPQFAHDGDLGVDLVCTDVEYDYKKDRYIYHTGLTCESPRCIGCFAMPQSRNTKTEFYLANSVGLIDTFLYRGEICLIYKNRDNIENRIFRKAVYQFLKLPWYKRLFSNFVDYWYPTFSFETKNAIDLAPYGIGETCGQLVFYIKPELDMKEVSELSETKRGTGGFGSSKRKNNFKNN